MNTSKERQHEHSMPAQLRIAVCARPIAALILLFMSRFYLAIPHFNINAFWCSWLVARVLKIMLCHNLLNLLCLNVDNFPNINMLLLCLVFLALVAFKYIATWNSKCNLCARENHAICKDKYSQVKYKLFFVCGLPANRVFIECSACCSALIKETLFLLYFCFLCSVFFPSHSNSFS